jgi:hypothetical protein
MRYTLLDIHSALNFVLLRCPNCVEWAGDGYSTHRVDHVIDLSLPGSCTKTDQEELLGVWNGLNWLRRECSGAILRTRYWARRGISDQLLKKCSVPWVTIITTTTVPPPPQPPPPPHDVTKNMLLWTGNNHKVGVVFRFAFCTLERDLDNLWCRLERTDFPTSEGSSLNGLVYTEEKLPVATNYRRCKRPWLSALLNLPSQLKFVKHERFLFSRSRSCSEGIKITPW